MQIYGWVLGLWFRLDCSRCWITWVPRALICAFLDSFTSRQTWQKYVHYQLGARRRSPDLCLQLLHLPPAAARPEWTLSCCESPDFLGETFGEEAAGQSTLAQSLARGSVQPPLPGVLFTKHWCCPVGGMSCPVENSALAASL